MEAITHIKYQCINLITPSLITSRSSQLIPDGSYLPKSLKDGFTVENGYLYVYEDPTEDMFLFIEDAEHPSNLHNPEDDHRFLIYRIDPNNYRGWKDGVQEDRSCFSAAYVHRVFRIIDEFRMTGKPEPDCWKDMVGICKKVLKIDLEEMAAAFAEANVFG